MKRLAKTLIVGALLVGGTIPILPSVANHVDAAPSYTAKAKKTFQKGYFIVTKNDPASTGQFTVSNKSSVYFTFETTATKKSNYRYELVRIGTGPGTGVIASYKGTAPKNKKKVSKLLAKNVKKRKYFVRVYNETAGGSIKFTFKIHN